MASVRRAYTDEYAFNYIPQEQPERVRRTRQRPQAQPQQPTKKQIQTGTLSADTLRALIAATIVVGLLLIGNVIINAYTAELQYDINQIERQNGILQTEINLLEVKIGSNTSVQELEAYAMSDLNMHYPEGNECVHLSTVEAPKGLTDIIRQKAYA